MRNRCNNPNSHRYHRYGGRGITVCERWDDYRNFLADMGEAPAGKSIERKDSNKGYEPGNCYWATPKEQGANTMQNRMITVGGETFHLTEWARRLGIGPDVLWKRLKRHGRIEV
jgi:transcriptional regulator of acetoin/glycerol metabolism